MTLYANGNKLTELFSYDETAKCIRINKKAIYLGELYAFKRDEDATYEIFDVETVYTKPGPIDQLVGTFVYNDKGEIYIVSNDSTEYCFYVKSVNKTTKKIVISYDTYSNVKSGNLSNELPLGEEAISYTRDETSDITF